MEASVQEARTKLSQLLDAVARGERVVITRHGRPAAELVPARTGKLRLGSLAGKVGEVPDAFFEPMTEAELRAWEGG